MANVLLTAEAVRELGKLPNKIRARIARLTERLEDFPDVSGVKWLSGDLAGIRIRQRPVFENHRTESTLAPREHGFRSIIP